MERLMLLNLIGRAVAVTLAGALACGASAQVAVRAGKLHTMAGPMIDDGVVVIVDGKIAAIGPAATTQIPEGFRVLTGAIATPGLIDARCTVGVSGLLNQKQDQDQLERSGAIQPELRAIDAYNPLDPLVEYVRSFGITTVNTGHAPGELVSGQTALIKLRGTTVDRDVIKEVSGVAVTIGPGAQRDASPGTRAKQVSMLREQLIKACEYQKGLEKASAPKQDAASDAKKEGDKPAEPPTRDLRLEMLAMVLRGEVPLLVSANRAQDIASVLRLTEEFGLRIVLDSGAEAYLLAEQLKAASVPVILHPTMVRAFGEMENMSVESAAMLRKAGIDVAIQGGFESYVPKARVVLFEAAIAAANGLAFEDALATVTTTPAEILGVSDRIGSLEVGKDGDVALFSGDPFEYTTHCIGVVIDGQVVSEKVR
jgi:imidazolonepropionase-like amidohydrolase